MALLILASAIENLVLVRGDAFHILLHIIVLLVFFVAGNRFGKTRRVRDEFTARLRASDELTQERSLWHTIINTLPDFIYVKDRQGRYVLNNEAHLAFLGADQPGQIAGKTVHDLFSKELADGYAADDRRTIEQGESLICDIEPCRDRSGNPIWMATTKVPLRDPQGAVVGLVGIARNVTQKHELEQRLRESEMRFRLVAQSACDGIISADADGKIVFWNKAAEGMFGYSESEALGRPLSHLLVEKEDIEALRLKLSGDSDRHEHQFPSQLLKLHCVRKQGLNFPVELSLASWKTENNQFFTMMIRDITAQRRQRISCAGE